MATALAAVGALVMSGGLVMLGASAATAGNEGTPQGNETKTAICHRTASDSNPYVFIEVDNNSLDAHYNNLAGHPAKQWKSAGIWREKPHVAGDLKTDYAASSESDCTDSSQTFDACENLPGFQEEGFECTKESTKRTVPRHEIGCFVQGPEGAVGGEWTWINTYTTTYAFDALEQEWVGTEGAAVAGPKEWRSFTPQERSRYECDATPPPDACPQLDGTQPAGFLCTKGPDVTRVPRTTEGCLLAGPTGATGGVKTWTEVTTTTYAFDARTQQWVAASTTGPVIEDEVFTPYTEQQRLEKGCDQIAGVEEVAPEIAFTDPDCDNLDGADWSGNLTEIVAYEVTGTPGLGESITVTASIKPALADQYAFPEGFDATFDHTYPTLAELECVLGEETVVATPKPEQNPPVVLGTEAAVPTQVHAGLASLPGTGSTNALLAQLLVGTGLILLVAGGWVGFAGRDYGKHHI